MKTSVTTLLFLTLLSSAMAETTPLSNTMRRRSVRYPGLQPATLSARVLDEVTRVPLANAFVQVGERSTTSDVSGRFTISGVLAGSQMITIHRAGYRDLAQTLSLSAGTNNIDLTLTPKATASLTRMNATVSKLDPDTIEFGYVVTFVGYVKGPELKGCDRKGVAVSVTRASIARIPGPARDVSGSSCCGTATAQQITLELKDGSSTDVTLKDTCQSYRLDLIAEDATTGEPVFVPLSEVSRLTMP